MKKYYHATPYENLPSIVEKGILVSRFDKVVYLTTSPESAANFVHMRGCKDILVLEVSLEESLVEESFDHNEKFWRCKAYYYPENIDKRRITNLIRYQVG